jgi:DNA replicative helicase MCM subunit Mcm2 (Cdc46/Mcm family)
VRPWVTAVAALAPRGLYVSGRSVSKAGLTATVVRDSSTGGHTFEAGAMVGLPQWCTS